MMKLLIQRRFFSLNMNSLFYLKLKTRRGVIYEFSTSHKRGYSYSKRTIFFESTISSCKSKTNSHIVTFYVHFVDTSIISTFSYFDRTFCRNMCYKLKSFVVFFKVLSCLLISRSFGNIKEKKKNNSFSPFEVCQTLD